MFELVKTSLKEFITNNIPGKVLLGTHSSKDEIDCKYLCDHILAKTSKENKPFTEMFVQT